MIRTVRRSTNWRPNPLGKGAHRKRTNDITKEAGPQVHQYTPRGTLTDSDHQLLALWAAKCAEHVLHLFEFLRNLQTRGLARRSLKLGYGCAAKSR